MSIPTNTKATKKNQQPTSQKDEKPDIGVIMFVRLPAIQEEEMLWVVSSAIDGTIKKAGGNPKFLMYEEDRIEEFADNLKALVIPGNSFDIAEPERLPKPVLRRLSFEMKLATEMLKRGKPVFGVCGGMHTMIRLFGGELYKDIPTELPDSKVNHNSSTSYKDPVHDIIVARPDGFVAKALKNIGSMNGKVPHHIGTNGVHHQGASSNMIPPVFTVEGLTEDAIIEAASLKDKKGRTVFMGVQFHPEFRHRQTKDKTATDYFSENLWKEFVELAKEPPSAPEDTKHLIEEIEKHGMYEKISALPGVTKNFGIMPLYARPGDTPENTTADKAAKPSQIQNLA